MRVLAHLLKLLFALRFWATSVVARTGNFRIPKTIGKRRTVLVDRDNFDEVLSSFGAEIQLPIGDSGSLRLRFADLDDFHPDRVFEHLEAFGKLRDLRARLQDPSTFKKAAEELGVTSAAPAEAQPRPIDGSRAVAPSATRLASGSLLDEMIEQTESRASEARPNRAPDEVREFAQRAAAKYLVSTPDPRQGETLGVMDRAIGGLMRAVLHNPHFQALEAIWRATFFLVRQLETSSQLKLFLIDISREELAADLSSGADLRDTGAYRLLVEKSVGTPGADPWAVIVGNYSFGAGKEDAVLLAQMARIARRAGAPFLGGGQPSVAGLLVFGVYAAPSRLECFPRSKLLVGTQTPARIRGRRTRASTLPVTAAVREENVSSGILRFRGIPRTAVRTRTTCGGILLFWSQCCSARPSVNLDGKCVPVR